MRKRRDLSDDEKAVSTVIAVTLMVAVAVAMAAVSYAYFTGMIGGRNIEAEPIIEFTPDYNDNTLTFTYTDTPDIDWSDLSIIGVNQSGPQIDVDLVAENNKIGTADVGEKIFVNECGLEGTVLVTVVHLPSDVMMHEFTFEDVTQ